MLPAFGFHCIAGGVYAERSRSITHLYVWNVSASGHAANKAHKSALRQAQGELATKPN
jgi:hypothetical protein